jgi:predicted ATPase/class 3 adenylate cyclase
VNTASHTDTVTFLFTDIEGSTRMWEQEPDRMRPALARHDALVRETVEANHGVVVKMIGDGVHAAFADPVDAVSATLQLQQSLADSEAANGVALRVRCGLHAGIVERRDNDFFGSPVNRAARIMRAAHGGQVLLSQAVAALVTDRLPAEVSIRDLGAARLRDLASAEHVYQLVHPRLRQVFPALRTLEATPNNLPQQLTSFIGRERELIDVKKLLGTCRLLTLLGVGGIGKTRLLLQVAADVMDQYPDGVWFVELAPVADARLVTQVVASVLGVKEETGCPVVEALVKRVKDRQLLLILDNCEHLVHACAKLADTLLSAAPAIRILVSSREPLQIGGEQNFPLTPLSLPLPNADLNGVARAEAVQLFVERARLQQPGFGLTERHAPAVAELCARLDGIPLALELAAGRVRSLSIEEINARLNDRFKLLTGGARTALPRQQTLRASIDWSYELLSAAERALLRRLSVFAGSWTLAAAEAVGAGDGIAQDDVLNLLASLVEKSLVLAGENGDRYRMLETIRQFAQERLQGSTEEASVRNRHLDHFLALVEAAAPTLPDSQDGPKWMGRLDLEHDNLQNALAWSLTASGTTDAAMRICWALYRFWLVRAHWQEGRKWCAAALALDTGDTGKAARARVLLVAGGMAERLGEATEAKALCEEALALCRDTRERALEARVLNLLAGLLQDQGEYTRARSLLEQAILINREVGNRLAEVINVGNLGLGFLTQGNFAAARAPLERYLALSRELGNRYYEASAYRHLGLLAYYQDNYVAAQGLQERALTIFRELGVPANEVDQLRNLAETAVTLGELNAAVAYFAQALKAHRELGYRQSVADCFDGMVALAVKTQAYVEAAELCGAADALRDAVGAPANPSDSRRHSVYRHQCREALAEPAYEAAYTAGRTLTTAVAIERALVWLGKRELI